MTHLVARITLNQARLGRNWDVWFVGSHPKGGPHELSTSGPGFGIDRINLFPEPGLITATRGTSAWVVARVEAASRRRIVSQSRDISYHHLPSLTALSTLFLTHIGGGEHPIDQRIGDGGKALSYLLMYYIRFTADLIYGHD
jgi:hypothetical protein